MSIDPIWFIVAGTWLVGVLCGLAWHEARVEAARQDGHTSGMREGYMQGRADAVTVAKQQLAREMGHETQGVQSVRDAIRAATIRMHNYDWRLLNGQIEEEQE